MVYVAPERPAGSAYVVLAVPPATTAGAGGFPMTVLPLRTVKATVPSLTVPRKHRKRPYLRRRPYRGRETVDKASASRPCPVFVATPCHEPQDEPGRVGRLTPAGLQKPDEAV